MIEEKYCDWLYDMVCDSSYSKGLSYHKLFEYLYSTDFYWIINKDENRAIDGLYLRYAFANACGLSEAEIYNAFYTKSCSVLGNDDRFSRSL